MFDPYTNLKGRIPSFNKGKEARKELALGIECQKKKQYSAAADHYSKSIYLNSGSSDAYNNLGVILRKQGHTQTAISCYQKSLDINPKNPGIYSNLGNALRDLGNLKLAVTKHRKAISLAPNNPECYFNLGLVLHDLGYFKDALKAYEKAIYLQPENTAYKWDKALTLLTKGDFLNGFNEYEIRWKLKTNSLRNFTEPKWTGQSLKGKILLIYQEQGFGDMIQFSRFIPMIKKRGGTIILEIQPELSSLFSNLVSADKIFKKGDSLPNYDFCIPMMSLAKILQITIKRIPLSTSFLITPPTNLMSSMDQKLHIGIVWAGKQTHKNDKNRSCKFKYFIDLFSIPNTCFYSLQKGARETDIKDRGCESLIINLAPQLHDFKDTASAISKLDLILSVDTATAHLAGSIGKPTWILLPFSPDWRWMRASTASPWYPSMHLIRQSRPKDWESVLKKVKKKLQRLTFKK